MTRAGRLGLSQSPTPQLPALTSIRFFFAAMVLVGHFFGYFGSDHYWPGFSFNIAPMAVSWFFLLSGFIIAYNYPALPGPLERKSFLISRVARLWPVHVVTTFAMILLFGGGKYFPFVFTMTHTWTANPEMSAVYNGPCWSISDEMFFYVAYVAPARWLRVLVVAVPIGLAVVLAETHGCFLPAGDPASAASTVKCSALIWTFPPARLIEFLAGVALFRWRPRIPQIVGLLAAVGVVGGFLPEVPGLDRNSLSAHVIWQLEVIVGGGALIASLAREGWLARILSVRLLIIGGEISYSMYMTHEIVNLAILPHLGGLSLTATFALSSTITLAVSACLFYVLEAPARDAVKAKLRQWKARANAREQGMREQAQPAAARPLAEMQVL
jgi:peptidoglycan/LPS O-acetylase OafA/YrhL